MKAQEIIELMGGRKQVMAITGLTKGRLSQWVSGNKIPRYWMLEFHLQKPDVIPDPRNVSTTSTSREEGAHA